ncbi:MAG TPA: Maf family protein [Chthoniobacterales bacterium]|nr:Maf family protein [Chthoniobacterales bacterium]
MATRLLLASDSPRRHELLATAGFEFESMSPGVGERFDVDLTLCELTAFNAIRKGRSVARLRPEAVVLAADTLVGLDDEIIGKPTNLDHAAKILRRLSGRVHEVCSAVFICHLASNRSTSFYEISRVRFHRLNKEEIDNYLTEVNPLDKAGSYAAQGGGATIIARIEGSFSNVIGLPMEKTVAALAAFGIEPKSA